MKKEFSELGYVTTEPRESDKIDCNVDKPQDLKQDDTMMEVLHTSLHGYVIR